VADIFDVLLWSTSTVCGYGYGEHSPSSYTLDAENTDAAMSLPRLTDIHKGLAV